MQLDSSVVAVITGGASGLGEATARVLAAKGVKVALFDLNAERGQAVAQDIGGHFFAVDVTSDESVDAGFSKARAAHGQERILVNCAGVGNAIKTAFRDKKTGSIGHFPSLEFDRIIQINLVGTFRCMAKSAAGMLAADSTAGDRGVIINTASVAAEDGQVGQAAYSASKAGIVGLTLPVARDLATERIRVNTILPGYSTRRCYLPRPRMCEPLLPRWFPTQNGSACRRSMRTSRCASSRTNILTVKTFGWMARYEWRRADGIDLTLGPRCGLQSLPV